MRSPGVGGILAYGFVLALVITAATLPNRQTADVVSALTWGGTHLAEASLGETPTGH